MDLLPALLYVLLRAVNALALADAHEPVQEPAPLAAPCDPGFGFPEPRAGCPDPKPLLGRVTSYDDGMVTVQRDQDGPVMVKVLSRTVCTGVIEVGYVEPLRDRVVGCAAFEMALRRHGAITSALWFDEGRLVQLSELYRP